MRITANNGIVTIRETNAAQPAEPGAARPAVRVDGEALQSGVLKPAQAELAAMPDVDAARVAEIKAALADGRIQFDAGKLAGLIRRYHGPHG